MKWYALFVETGKEVIFRDLIYKYVDKSIVRPIVPKRKILERRKGQNIDVCKIMFPGYVLLQTHMSTKLYYQLKKMPCYFRLLNNYKYTGNLETDEKKKRENREIPDSYMYFEIPDDEMAVILQLIGHDQVINYSTIYIENSKVVVKSGPLKGKEGIIKKIDKRKKRAEIVLNFMGNTKTIDVGVEILSLHS